MKPLSGLLALLMMTGAAQSASFNCDLAKSRVERSICGNAQLSLLDESLASAYWSARNSLSTQAKKTFLDGQSSWVRFISTSCFLDDNAAGVAATQAQHCLIEAYQNRIKDIEATGQLVAGFKTYVLLDNAIKVSAKDKSVHTVERRAVQLDDASTPVTRINQYLGFSDKIEMDDARGSEVEAVRVSNPAKDWLYKELDGYSDTGAYPNSYKTCGVYRMSAQRPLLIGDVFSGPKWKAIAEKEARAHFAALAKKDPEFQLDMVTDYASFRLNADQEFPYCIDATGITAVGFFPHAAQVFDGVPIKWSAFASVLTPYAKEQIQSLSGK